jgi:S1-C subfamily serine protease
MRQALAILLALAASACSWPAGAEPWDSVHKATKVIGIGEISCSATAVGRYHLLTASHCFDGKPATITVNGKVCEVWRLTHDGNDHALVLLGWGCEQKHRVRISHRKVPQGESVFIWGNPSFLDDQLRIGRASGWGFLPGATGGDDPLTKKFRYWDIASTYGDSGSAIFDMQGRVVGVLSIGTDPITNHFHLAGSLPFAFTRKQWREARR